MQGILYKDTLKYILKCNRKGHTIDERDKEDFLKTRKPKKTQCIVCNADLELRQYKKDPETILVVRV